MKKCCKCQVDKDLDEFPRNKSKRGGYSESCLICTREYIKAHYKKNRAYYSCKARKRETSNYTRIMQLKHEVGCKECGESHPACLDFHHRDPSIKEFTISSKIQGFSWSRLIKEIEKCDILCANCHRKLHYRLKGKIWSPGCAGLSI
jgi:hypothetical protein